jgi:MarR family transcriptional regulator, transcriptional regulator for hemolysin
VARKPTSRDNARHSADDEGAARRESASLAAARIENVGFLIADVTRLMRKGFDRRVRGLGLTRPQWRVLVYVLQNEGLSQSALARAMDIERAPLGQLVRALENLDLVRRERSTLDQREWQIFAGESARGVMPELLTAAEWLRGVYFQGLSRSEEQMLRRILERMRSNLSFELER